MSICKHVNPSLFSDEEIMESMAYQLLADIFPTNELGLIMGLKTKQAEWNKEIEYCYFHGEYVGFVRKQTRENRLYVDFHRFEGDEY